MCILVNIMIYKSKHHIDMGILYLFSKGNKKIKSKIQHRERDLHP